MRRRPPFLLGQLRNNDQRVAALIVLYTCVPMKCDSQDWNACSSPPEQALSGEEETSVHPSFVHCRFLDDATARGQNGHSLS